MPRAAQRQRHAREAQHHEGELQRVADFAQPPRAEVPGLCTSFVHKLLVVWLPKIVNHCGIHSAMSTGFATCETKRTMDDVWGMTTTNTRVDAAVIHYLS